MAPVVMTDAPDDVASVPIKAIILTGSTQPRDEVNPAVVADYAEEMLSGVEFPPVTLFHDGSHYYPSDGYHRIKAALRAKLTHIRATVTPGTQRDAIYAGFAANASHGVRRSNADKRRAVTRMLEDDEWTRLSDSAIARHCQVSAPFVGSLRVKLGIVGSGMRIVTNSRGTTYTTNTANNGRPKANRYRANLDAPESPIQANLLPVTAPTRPTLFEAWLKKVRARGVEAKTHVQTEFGQIDISTEDAVYIIAGAMTPRVFRDAFVTLLFQRESRGKGKRAVIVGTTDAELAPWVKEAKRLGVEVVEFNG